MYRKSFLVFALVFVFALVLAVPVSARQIIGGGGTSDEVTLTQLNGNRAGLNIVFEKGIEANTEGLAIFVNGHLYECVQTSLKSIYCVGYFDQSWDAISVTAFTLFGTDVTNLVLDVDVPLDKKDGAKEVANGKDDSTCESEIAFEKEGECSCESEIPFGKEDECSEEEEPTFCELNPSDPTCTEEEPTFCELNPSDPTCNEEEPTFCELNPSDPTCNEEEPTFCELNPSDPTCNEEEPTFCELNPSDPSCGGGEEPTFCELNPGDPSCGGGGGGSETPVDCELTPSDPACNY
jgi:hypothetical protein